MSRCAGARMVRSSSRPEAPAAVITPVVKVLAFPAPVTPPGRVRWLSEPWRPGATSNRAWTMTNVKVVDRRAVLSAYGPLTVAVSEHAAFAKDSITTRLTWRIGAAITHPERVVELTVVGAEETTE